MTGTNCDLFTHNQSRSYLNHLVYRETGRHGVTSQNINNFIVTSMRIVNLEKSLMFITLPVKDVSLKTNI